MVNIAVLGYGTVGSGVVEVINTNHDIVNKRAGQEINVKRVLDLREFSGDPVENILTHDFEDILNDDDISVVVEVMGGVDVIRCTIEYSCDLRNIIRSYGCVKWSYNRNSTAC